MYISIYVSIYLSVCLSIYLYVLVWWCVISEARSLFRGDVGDVVLNCLYIYIHVCIHIIGTSTVRYNTGWCILTPCKEVKWRLSSQISLTWLKHFEQEYIFTWHIHNIIYSYDYDSYYYSYTYIYRYICIFKTCRIHQPLHYPWRKKNRTFQVTLPIPMAIKQANLLHADHVMTRVFSEPSTCSSVMTKGHDIWHVPWVKIDSHDIHPNSVVTHASS